MRTTDSISEFTTWRFCNIFMKQDEVLCVWTVFVRPSLRCGVHATSLNAAVALGSNNVGLLAVIEAAVANSGKSDRCSQAFVTHYYIYPTARLTL